MMPLIWVGVRAVVLCLILTPIVRDIFRSFGVVDKPDSGRKQHRYPIPRVGGIAVAVSYFASIYLGGASPGGFTEHDLSLVWAILPAALVVFAVGLVDDFLGLKPWQKLTGQLLAVGIAYWCGVRVLSLGGHPVSWWSIPITMVWLLACTNAFNLVDGLDGLAAGVGLFATLTMFAVAILQHQGPLACATLPLAGCLLAFLCYNSNPATIFLGDCGSLLIGFLLGCYGVIWSQKSITLVGMTAPLMTLSIPLLDVLVAIVRRFLRRQPIFRADRGHIHHRLIDRGLTPRQAVLLVYAFCGLAAGFSLLQTWVRNAYFAVLVVGLFCIVAWIGLRYLSYAEFILFGRVFRVAEFQRALNSRLTVHEFANALQEAADVPECWRVLREYYPRLGFRGVCVHFGGLVYREWPSEAPAGLWFVQIPVSSGGRIDFAGEVGGEVPPGSITAVVEVVHKTFDGLSVSHAGGHIARAAGAS